MNDLDTYWKNIEVTASTPKNNLRFLYGFNCFGQEAEKDESTHVATNIDADKFFEATKCNLGKVRYNQAFQNLNGLLLIIIQIFFKWIKLEDKP
jgi:hypothetical protein